MLIDFKFNISKFCLEIPTSSSLISMPVIFLKGNLWNIVNAYPRPDPISNIESLELTFKFCIVVYSSIQEGA